MAGKVSTQLVIEGRNNSKAAFDQVKKDLDAVNTRLERSGEFAADLLKGGAVLAAATAFADMADKAKLMEAKLKLATDSQEEFTKAQSELRRIADEAQSPVESLVTLYGRIARPLKEAGRSQEDILAITELVSKSFLISGATAEEAQNGVIQFAQALGSGALRGDEFNSIAEQAPRLMKALADGLGVPVSKLREMAAAGLLTTDVITNALLPQLEAVRKDADSIPTTVGGAMTKLNNSLLEFAGSADSATGFTQGLIDRIGLLGSAADYLKKALDGFNKGGFKGLEDALSDQRAKLMAAATKAILERLKEARAELQKDGEVGIGARVLFGKKDAEWYDKQIAKYEGAVSKLEDAEKKAAATAKENQNDREGSLAAHVAKMGDLRDQLAKDGEDTLKRQVAAEKAAAADLAKAKQAQLETEKLFKEALGGLRAGPAGEASYGQAQALKVGARAALKAGDVEGAKQQAIAALDVLKELQAAGENTYGFDGFIKELQAIAVGADRLNVSNLEASAAAATLQTARLKEELEKIKNASITPKLDQASLDAVSKQLQAFAQQIGQTLTIPVSVVSAGAATADIQGHATGGYIRGPGTGTSDSILARLSNGEYVMRAAAVRKWGVNALDRLNGLQLPKFADGGLVSAATQAGEVLLTGST